MAIGASLAGHAAEPANPSATLQVHSILNYFHEFVRPQRKPAHSVGQFSDFGNAASLRIMEQIQEKTGRWPGLIGVD